MKNTAPCSLCQTLTDVASAQFRAVTGLLFLSHTKTTVGLFCEPCAKKTYLRSQLHNLLLGWWSGPSMISTPILLIQNHKNKTRHAAQLAGTFEPPSFHSDPKPLAIQRLPWASFLDIAPRNAPLSKRTLTPPIALGSLAAFALFISLIALITLSISIGNNTPAEANYLRAIFRLILVAALLAIPACVYWQMNLNTRIADQAPDLLAKLFPTSVIFQFPRAQLTAFATEISGQLRLAIFTQNLYSEPSTLSLSIHTYNTTFPLQSPLRPSEVVCFYASLPLLTPGVSKATLQGDCIGRGGHLTRSSQRVPLTSQSRANLLTAAKALAGQVSLTTTAAASHLAFMDENGKLALSVPTSYPDRSFTPVWRRIVLWHPENQLPVSYSASLIADLLRKPTTANPSTL